MEKTFSTRISQLEYFYGHGLFLTKFELFSGIIYIPVFRYIL